MPSRRLPAWAVSSAHVDGSRARTVNVGASPVSIEGWPKHSPGSSTWTGSPSWMSSIEPVRSTQSPAAGRPSSTSTAWPVSKLRSCAPAVSSRSSSAPSASNGACRERNVSKCSM